MDIKIFEGMSIHLENVDAKIADAIKELAFCISYNTLSLVKELDRINKEVFDLKLNLVIDTYILKTICNLKPEEYRALKKLVLDELKSASESYNRTLTDEEIIQLDAQIQEKIRKKLGVIRNE
jgi:hypothetical protein